MKVLIVEPKTKPYVKEIESNLKELQQIVGGRIEVLYPFNDKACIICNEEGKIHGLEPNRGLFNSSGDLYDIIAGKFIIAGLSDDNFDSLTDEQIEKYSKKYNRGEVFVKFGDEILAIPIDEE